MASPQPEVNVAKRDGRDLSGSTYCRSKSSMIDFADKHQPQFKWPRSIVY
jgi:hypothetical protein